MKKEIRKITTVSGEKVLQITLADERWYCKKIDGETLTYKFVKSVTWICSFYPKGIAFFKWLASKGWDEAEAIKKMAGDKGSKVHLALGAYLSGVKVKMDDKFFNKTTEQDEELTVAEYECILAFDRWFKKVNPEIYGNEITEFNCQSEREEEHYAGTVDLICRIHREVKDGRNTYSPGIYIIDFKTGQYLWPEHELQISAYSHLDFVLEELHITKEEWAKRKLAILQLGYKRNKNQYKFTEIEDKFDLFLHASAICENETKGIEPKQKDYPLFVQRETQEEFEERQKKFIESIAKKQEIPPPTQESSCKATEQLKMRLVNTKTLKELEKLKERIKQRKPEMLPEHWKELVQTYNARKKLLEGGK